MVGGRWGFKSVGWGIGDGVGEVGWVGLGGVGRWRWGKGVWWEDGGV